MKNEFKVPRGSQAPTPATKSYTKAEKEAYQRKVAPDLNEMQQKIAELKIKSRRVVQQNKRMMIKTLINLQNIADSARRRLTAVKTLPNKIGVD